MQLHLKTVEDTIKFAACLASCLKQGDVVALVGDLGAGKTTLTQALGRQLGVNDFMTSPTFAIVNQYDLADGLFVHADLYRLTSEDELDDIGFEHYFDDVNIIVVEWADKFSDWLNAYANQILWLHLNYAEQGRILKFSGAPDLIKKLEKLCY